MNEMRTFARVGGFTRMGEEGGRRELQGEVKYEESEWGVEV
jgi:hypothetical protein